MKFLRKSKEDKGAANTVSFIFIIFLVMWILISFIDVGIYFNVKNEMRSAAENGARNVALYGGTGGDLRLERTKSKPAVDVVRDSITTSSSSPVVQLKDITCGPDKTEAGSEVYCNIDYQYVGLAGKFGMFMLGNSDVSAKGTAVSEVNVTR